VLATCTALTVAFIRQRQGRSTDFNVWLRWRVGLQGMTILAIVGGSYALGNTKQQQEVRAHDEQERLIGLAAKDRAAFEERLRAAEEAHAAEESIKRPLATSDMSKSAPAGVAGLRRADETSGPAGTTPAGVQRMNKESVGLWDRWGPSGWWGSGNSKGKP
jgi:hypothetical protein